jgi:hypothetical protein
MFFFANVINAQVFWTGSMRKLGTEVFVPVSSGMLEFN